MIPLIHDLSNKSVLIFGGGEVGTHKAQVFLNEAEVHVISSDFTTKLKSMNVELHDMRLKRKEDVLRIIESINYPFIAITATGKRKVDDMIADVSREQGLLVNKTSGPPGDLLTPSIIDHEPVIVGITTKGKSPAMSKYLRKELEPILEGSEFMANLQAELRDELEGCPDKTKILREILEDSRVWEVLEKDYDKAKELAYEVIEKYEE